MKIMKIICTDYRIVVLGLIPWGSCMFGNEAENVLRGRTRYVKERKGAAVKNLKIGQAPKACDLDGTNTQSEPGLSYLINNPINRTRTFRISLKSVNVGKYDLTILSLDGRTDSLV